MTAKQELVKGFVYVTASWVDSTHAGEIFRSANVTPEREVVLIPATKIDVSDHISWKSYSGRACWKTSPSSLSKFLFRRCTSS